MFGNAFFGKTYFGDPFFGPAQGIVITPPIEEVVQKGGGGPRGRFPNRYIYPVREDDADFNRDDKDIIEIVNMIMMTGIFDETD